MGPGESLGWPHTAGSLSEKEIIASHNIYILYEC